MNDIHTCGTCRFWRGPIGSNDGGWCRRYAPRPLTIAEYRDDDVETPSFVREVEFPITEEWEWCGEHEPKGES